MKNEQNRLQELVCWEPHTPAPGEEATMSISRSHPAYGDLNLHVSAEYSRLALAENRPPLMQTEDIPEAQAALNEILAMSDRDVGYQAMSKLSERFPFWPMAHGAMFDYARARGDFDKAIYHVQQLIFTAPEFKHVNLLGQVYGQSGRFEDSRVVLYHLFENRDQATSDGEAMSLFGDLFVTLRKTNDGDEMVRIADQLIAEYGANSWFEFEAILGWLVQDKKNKAIERLRQAMPEIDPQDPLMFKFNELQTMLGVQQ